MSASPPKADSCIALANVCFVPISTFLAYDTVLGFARAGMKKSA